MIIVNHTNKLMILTFEEHCGIKSTNCVHRSSGLSFDAEKYRRIDITQDDKIPIETKASEGPPYPPGHPQWHTNYQYPVKK